MVLRALLTALILLSGCIQPKPSPKLSEPTAVRAAYIMTFPGKPDVAAVPDAVHDAVAGALGARNLQPRVTDVGVVAKQFERKRSTEARLELLAAQAVADGEPFVLLVETTPRYYSLLNGRYRWDVDLRVTFAPTAQLDDAQTQDWEITAFLDYDHQDHVDALAYSATPVADRVGRLVDQFLSGYDGATLAVTPVSKSGSTHPLRPGAALYFVMVDRFFNGDPSNDEDVDLDDPHGFHGGDLQGVTQKLDWISGLGITNIWLSPVFEMRTEKFHGHGAFHGYWVDDFGRIEGRFGGEPAFSTLGEALAARGMSMFLDVVLNHVAMDHPLVAEKPDWFHHNGGITDWDDPEQVVNNDVHGLPDLAQENPEVYDHLLQHSLTWLKAAAPAGFRLDAVKHVPSAFWTKYNADVKREAGSDFVMLGEDLQGNPAVVAQTMREGKFDAMFDFPLHFAMVDVFCGDAHPGRLAEILTADRLYPDTVGERREGLVTLLDNHDLPRILSKCGNDEGRVIDALRFMLTARGTPSFTWGTESGATGINEPDNRADMRFEMHPIGDAMTQWLKLRRETTPLTHGRDVLLSLSPSSFVYARSTAAETVVVSVNASNAPRTLKLPDADWRNIETQAKFRQPIAPPGVSAFVAPISIPVPDDDVVVEFRVTGAPEGEVRIVGSGPELGNWDPAKAPTAGAITLPRGAAFSFKPVVVSGDSTVWSEAANNYVLVESQTVVTAPF